MRTIWTNWNAIDEIETLRNDGVLLNEIELMLLSGKLGEIHLDGKGYQVIGNYSLSHLVIEVHNPGFIDCMSSYPWKYVVHHIDGNKLNNIFINLKVMTISRHSKMHSNARWDDSRNKRKLLRVMKKESWLSPESNPEFFKHPFTIRDYAELSKVSYGRAGHRLAALITESEITCEKKLINSKWHNVYLYV